MSDWVAAVRKDLAAPLPDGWGVVVDMRELQPLAVDVQAVMVEGQKLFKQRGMKRSAVALKDAITTMQFRRLARESGIDAWERYQRRGDGQLAVGSEAVGHRRRRTGEVSA